EVGQDVHIVGGSLRDAINRGVGKGYTEGFLRASIVDHPFSTRVNTKDNTPAVIHTEIVPGDKLRFTVVPKGGGCENMTRFQIMLPGRGKEGITEFVLNTIEESGGNPCPPLVVGVGVGGREAARRIAARASARARRNGRRRPDAHTSDK